MQALTPTISLGGLGQYMLSKNAFTTSYGASYDDNTNMAAAQYKADGVS